MSITRRAVAEGVRISTGAAAASKTGRILRHQNDTVYKSICMFFDKEARRCTIYKGRPVVWGEYPDGKKCGYYDFIKFERKHQQDPAFVPSA